MSKHTPGPWAVHGDIGTLIGSDDRKMMLAEVLYKHVVTEWGRPLDEAQANARLIAAAPDLLACLKALVAERNDLAKQLAEHTGIWCTDHGAREWAYTLLNRLEPVTK